MLEKYFESRINSKNSFFYLLLGLLVFTVSLSAYLSTRVLILCLIFSLFLPTSFARIVNQSWDIIFYLLILAVGLIYTDDLTTGLKALETASSLIAMALIFSKLNDRILELIKLFIAGLCLSSIVCLINASIGYVQSENLNLFFFYDLTNILGIQPTYFAYYIIFAISSGLFFLYYDSSRRFFLVKSIAILFLFLMLILTGGQTAFISMLFVFSFFILKYLTEEKNRSKTIVIGIVILMLSCMFLVTFLESMNRMAVLNDSWERSILWESALTAIPNVFLGVGTGDYKTVLNQYYMSHDLNMFATESYNSHNQVIQLLFSNGILGVLGFGCMVARPLYLAVRNKNTLAILCLFPFLIYGMTEVFLGRYQGVVFFALLHQIFIAEMNHQKSPFNDPIDITKNLNVKPI